MRRDAHGGRMGGVGCRGGWMVLLSIALDADTHMSHRLVTCASVLEAESSSRRA